MSNSELLRIKNKQKTPYKKKRLQAVMKYHIKRPNDRFGINPKNTGLRKKISEKVKSVFSVKSVFNFLSIAEG